MTATEPPPAPAAAGDRPANGDRGRWWGLIVIALAQLMVVLDATIVNVALPTMQRDLHFSTADRQWVVTTYTLAFGGLVLLGGRIGDHTGRRRTFLIGLVGFAGASAVGGAAVNLGMLLTARAVQGCFGALLAPSALSLLATSFPDPQERRTAFAVFGAVAGGGSAVGLVLGGVLTEYLSWRWVLYVNSPIAVVAAVGALFLLHESQSSGRPRLDVVGLVLSSGGLVALVYGFTEAVTHGWSAPLTLGLVCGGCALLVLFVVAETMIRNPLLPLHIVRNRGRAAAYLAILLAGIGLFGMFFFVSFYLQTILRYSPVKTGLAFLPMTAGVVAASTLTSRIMTRVPARFLLAGGALIGAGGLAWLTQLQVNSSYASHILPSLIMVGLGLGVTFPPASNLATLRVPPRESGAASATYNMAQQVGGSLGAALLNTIVANRTATYLASHHALGPLTHLAALVNGYTVAVAWGAGILGGSALISLILVSTRFGATVPPGEMETGQGAGTGEPALQPGSHAEESSLLPVLVGVSRDRRTGVITGAEGRAVGGWQICGTVRRWDGEEIPGAVLTLVESRGRKIGTSATTHSGAFRIDAPGPGAYVLIATAGAYQPEARSVMLTSGPITVDLPLAASASLVGTVTASEGLPVAEARVTLAGHDGRVVDSRTTSAEGVYLFPELAAGEYTLMTFAEGFQPTAHAVTVPHDGRARHDVTAGSLAPDVTGDRERITGAMYPGGCPGCVP